MANYQIKNHQNGEVVQVEAQGVIEALGEHLPHPSIEVKINWCPSIGKATATDVRTNSTYTVKLLDESSLSEEELDRLKEEEFQAGLRSLERQFTQELSQS